ncbi:MAG: glycosyltransferase family 39 protein [Anaerolineae bacterium]|nr:glycosyltransferase family 39 protein [Anaerolineae bacterium]
MNLRHCSWPSARQARWLILGLTLAAFFLRVWRLGDVPPGWSDDELSDILVLTQKIAQGDYSVYYVDATGQEALYFVVSHFFLRLLGYNAFGIRLLSATLGTLAVPLIYQAGRRLFARRAGLLAAALLATSFWALIYARISLRQVTLPVFVLGTIYFFWTGVQGEKRRAFLIAGLWMGIGFYTYFAARGMPLILIAASAYVWLADRPRWRRTWRGQLLTLLVALLLAIPLVVTLQRMEGADARVAEVAVPIVAARDGDFAPLRTHIVRTLSMFHADGDDEFLYNIPGRPVFGPTGAIAFWAGVLLAVWYALRPLYRRDAPQPADLAAGFLLLWWLAGITPGFLSVPPASLGHTIVAQPATYLLAALPLRALAVLPQRRWLLPAFAFLLFAAGTARNLPDYFITWPQRGNTRFLYHADMRDVAQFVRENGESRDFAISGLLAGPWAREALRIDLENAGVSRAQPRWYNPQRAVVLALGGEPAVAFAGYPRVETVYDAYYQPLPIEAGGYRLFQIAPPPTPSLVNPVCFTNGLCLVAARYEPETGTLHLTWEVGDQFDLPPQPIVSKPPPPGVNDQPRLAVFAHLLDSQGDLITGDDGLWVDPQTLRPGDVFRQQHHLNPPPGAVGATIATGLYDPHTGERLLTETGRDAVSIPLE